MIVAPVQEARPLHHPLRLVPQHRDLPWARAVGGVGIEPEKAPLACDLAGRVEQLHPDVVEVRGPVHGRPRVGLGQGEQVLLAGETPYSGGSCAKLTEIGRSSAARRMPSPEPGTARSTSSSVLGEHVVLAVAEEGEVAVVHPLEQVASLGAVVGIDRGGLELGDGVVDALTHRRPVLDGGAHVTEHAADAGTEPLQLLGPAWRSISTWIIDSGRPSSTPTVEQPALLVPPNAHDRPDHEVDRAPVPRHLHRDRVDEEGHVVHDRLDDGVRRLPAVLLEVGRVDVDLELAGRPHAGEVPVRDRRAVQVGCAAVAQIVGSDVRVVRAYEPLEVFRLGVLDLVVDACDSRLEERRLSLIRDRRQSRTSPRVPHGL